MFVTIEIYSSLLYARKVIDDKGSMQCGMSLEYLMNGSEEVDYTRVEMSIDDQVT
jgi:hypothetical protein